MQICPNCSHRNRLGVIFCDNCGASLIGDSPLSTKNIAGNSSKADTGPMGEDLQAPGTDVFNSGTVLRLEIEGAEPILLKPKKETVFGRRDPATGTMPDVDLTPFAGYRMGVSRRHIVIRQSEDNRLEVIDLGSSNGTYINGQKLSANQPTRLRDGDELRLGQMVMKIFFQKPLVEDTPTTPKPPILGTLPTVPPAAASEAPAPIVITPPGVSVPARPEVKIDPPPVVPSVVPNRDKNGTSDLAGTGKLASDPNQVKPAPGPATDLPGTAKLPGPDSVKPDPGGTRILKDPDAKD